MSRVLTVRDLRKSYGRLIAVDGVSFEVGRNEILGLLGPNGAGKTTTLNMVLGILEPSSGTIEIGGVDLRTHRSRALEGVNFAAVYAALPGNLTVYQNLRIFGLLYGVKSLAARIRAIHEAGLILQIDSPDLAMDRSMFYRDLPDSQFVAACEMHVAAINKAIEGIPGDRVRLHCCWGNWDGPHVFDVALDLILPVLYQANVGGLSIEFANPRHQHEYEALRRRRFPDHMVLLPGVVETTSNIVEHPEVVARRIQEAVAAVGDRERVIASTDCGFGTFTRREWVIEPAVWLKLKSLRDGADIASSRLWGKKN